jgi:Lon protease-like protein
MYEIPLFPLNTVLFPGMPLSLNIFENRYKAMLQRVMQTNQTFGVNLIRSGSEALGPLPDPYMVGCTARVISIEPQEDGRFNLTVVGDERYRILQVSNSQAYLTGFVEALPLEKPISLEIVKGSHILRKRVLNYLALLSQHARQVEQANNELNINLTELELPEDPLLLIYLASALLQVPSNEKQDLLEAETAALLLSRVQRLYRRELAMLPDMLEKSEEQARASAWVN